METISLTIKEVGLLEEALRVTGAPMALISNSEIRSSCALSRALLPSFQN
jgi:hypothetical protein